ncbi:tRNA lysidine(34) synthetase TilS [Crocinitomicaceae bacterium]|nr:tRNA lysidine(34) synthetase TilS [Crocinitomicaceae bacterium]
MSLSIENSIQDFKKCHGISDNCMLITGVSGGMDSMVLLHALKNIHSKITVTHVNYMLRGQDSNEDAKLVEKIARDYALPFEKLEYNLQADLEANGGNLQGKARETRYSFFSSIMDQYEGAMLALAHHQNDQIENFWMQMARGGGIRAMSGMKEINKNTIRPLLPFSKAELSAYATKHHIEWREDISNKSNKYTRNIWRNVLIPELNKTIPNINYSVIKLQDVFRAQVNADRCFAQSKINDTKESFTLSYKELGTFNSNQLIEFLNHLKIPLSLALSITKLPFAPNGKKVFINEDRSRFTTIWREETGLYFQSKNEQTSDTPKIISSEAKSIPSAFRKDEFYFDKALIVGEISIRKWQEGDRIHPIGVKGSKLVSDILKDAKTPLRQRTNQYLLMDDEKPLALLGYCVDRRSISKTAPCLLIKIDL